MVVGLIVFPDEGSRVQHRLCPLLQVWDSLGGLGLPRHWRRRHFVRLAVNPLLWAIIGTCAIGMSFFTVALQRDAVTLVTAITLVFEWLAPHPIGIALLWGCHRPGRMAPCASRIRACYWWGGMLIVR